MGKALEVEGRRQDGLDGLRALAALAVFVGHIFTLSVAEQGIFDGRKNKLLTSGGLGVYIFFALSGYLLYRPFVRATTTGRGVRIGDYARNRALRILPLYFVVVAVVLIVMPFDADRAQWWRYVLFIENYTPKTVTFPDDPIWSLQVEVQYYVLLPLLAWLLAAVAGRRRAVAAAILVAIGVGSYALRRHGLDDHDQFGVFTGRSLPSLMYLFCGGMLVALLGEALRERPRRWQQLPVVGDAWAWIVAGALLYLVIGQNLGMTDPWIAVSGTLLVAGIALPLRRGRLWSAFSWRPLVAIGIASYSLYLWHVPLTERITGLHPAAVNGTLAVVGDTRDFKLLLLEMAVVMAAVTYVSYRFIEKPFLTRRKRWAKMGETPPPATTAPLPPVAEPLTWAQPSVD